MNCIKIVKESNDLRTEVKKKKLLDDKGSKIKKSTYQRKKEEDQIIWKRNWMLSFIHIHQHEQNLKIT